MLRRDITDVISGAKLVASIDDISTVEVSRLVGVTVTVATIVVAAGKFIPWDHSRRFWSTTPLMSHSSFHRQ
jgi:hypothetical protein